MIEILLLDLDDTILDFQKAEHIALGKTLEHFGIRPTDGVRSRYSQINKEHWEKLERKELTRAQVVSGRFAQLFQELGVVGDAEECAKLYAANLGIGHYFLPGAEEALKILSQKYRLFMASNGNLSVQRGGCKAPISATILKISSFPRKWVRTSLPSNISTAALPASRILTGKRP